MRFDLSEAHRSARQGLGDRRASIRSVEISVIVMSASHVQPAHVQLARNDQVTNERDV